MPSINNFLKGFQDGLPGMKDYQHASRLYVDDNFKLMPKQKFLYHVVINTDEELFFKKFQHAEGTELNMLVKACDLPKYGLNLEEKIQYNKKMYTATRIQYEPVNITFHDDHADTVNAFWKKYYEYNIADSVNLPEEGIELTKDDYYDPIASSKARPYTKFGLDTPKVKKRPYLKSIQIFVLHKQRFTSMTLVNPVIGSFSHDSLDQADGTGVLSNTMQVFYETVIYASGQISKRGVLPKGFATVRYDKSPSPLSVLGGGTNSIFGPGGIVDGVGSVITNLQNNNILGAILSASNTYNNAKKIKKKDVKEELKGIAKDGVLEVGKQAGQINSPVSQFTIGSAVLAGAAIASARGTADNKNQANNTVITNPQQDTVTYLTADEAYNLVNNNSTVRDQIAAGIYYKDIGSRTGLTVAQSDVQYTGSSDTVKTVYTNKVITDIRKLVTEGYIKIERQSQDVSISLEKATV